MSIPPFQMHGMSNSHRYIPAEPAVDDILHLWVRAGNVNPEPESLEHPFAVQTREANRGRVLDHNVHHDSLDVGDPIGSLCPELAPPQHPFVGQTRGANGGQENDHNVHDDSFDQYSDNAEGLDHQRLHNLEYQYDLLETQQMRDAQALTARINEVKNTVSALKKKFDDVTAGNQGFTQQVTHIENAVGALEEHVTNLKQDKEVLTRLVLEQSKKQEETNKKLTELTTKVTYLMQQVAELQQAQQPLPQPKEKTFSCC